MDADRLATRVARLTASPSRRGLLAALGALGLGAFLTYPDADAKHKGKHKHHKNTKKSKQKTQTVCLNGQSLVVPKSVVLSLLKQGATFGECAVSPAPPPPPPPSPPSPPSPPAPPPTCQELPDGADCGNGRQCSGGVCATPPTCAVLTDLAECSTSEQCCSGFCFITCGPSNSGQACRVDGDCTSKNCVGFICQ